MQYVNTICEYTKLELGPIDYELSIFSSKLNIKII